MNYDDLYLLKLIKRHEEMIGLVASRLGSVEGQIIEGISQMYEIEVDPISTGFLPTTPFKPALAFRYDPVTKNPIQSYWWQVSQQRWI